MWQRAGLVAFALGGLRRHTSRGLVLVSLFVCLCACPESGGTAAGEQADDDGHTRKKKRKKAAPSCKPCETGSCSADDAAACHALATQHGRGRGVPFDLGKKAHFEKLACDHDHGPGCSELAWLHHDGVGGVTHAVAVAAELNEKACRLEDGAGCTALGRMHELGVIGVADPQTAQTWFDRGREIHARRCDAGEVEQCAKLGDLYSDAVGVPAGDKKAYTAFEKGCPSGSARSEESCVGLALAFVSG